MEQPRGRARDLWIDGHREHDGAIAIVDDERGRDGLALRVVEAREPRPALLAEPERDLLEQRHRLGIGERRGLVAIGPLEARQPAQRAHALAQLREIVAERGHQAGAIGGVGRRERERDPDRAATGGRALDGEAGGRDALDEVRAQPRRIRERLEVEEIPLRGILDQRACERGPGAILPARAGEQIERGRPRAGVADHAELARVEQRDLDGASVERRDAADVAGGDVAVGLGGAADEHVELGVERVVIGEPPRHQPVGPAEQGAGAGPRERTPLSLERTEGREIAHYGDIDRHALVEVSMARVAIGNAGRCRSRHQDQGDGVHARPDARAMPVSQGQASFSRRA